MDKLSVSKTLYNDLGSITMLGDSIECLRKKDSIEERLSASTWMNAKEMAGCLLFFTHTAHNWYPSKLNLNKNRYN